MRENQNETVTQQWDKLKQQKQDSNRDKAESCGGVEMKFWQQITHTNINQNKRKEERKKHRHDNNKHMWREGSTYRFFLWLAKETISSSMPMLTCKHNLRSVDGLSFDQNELYSSNLSFHIKVV